jgi:two-component system, sensor histidine kinase and response regulator
VVSSMSLSAPITDPATTNPETGSSAAGSGGSARRDAGRAEASPARSIRVLVVEDDPVSQQVARRHLELLGCTVVVIDNGPAAISACAQQTVELVLMDLQLGQMDGLQASREIRRRERPGHNVPILALTASAACDEISDCAASGMNGLLTKPLQRASLAQAFERFGLARVEAVLQDTDVPNARDPVAPPVDLAALQAKFRGDTIFVRRLCETFATSTSQLLNSLTAAAIAGERPRVQALAHKIKGASNNIYAQRAAMLAARIESESLTLPPAHLNEVIDALRRAFGDVIAHISAELQ